MVFEQNTDVPVIAIDGVAGVGKSAVAEHVAKITGFNLLKSGLLYRFIGLECKRLGVTAHSEMGDLARSIKFNFHGTALFADGVDVTDLVGTHEAGKAAAIVAKVQEVRLAVRITQLAMRDGVGLVAEGRDMGEIFEDPNIYRVFLIASPMVRTSRRYDQLVKASQIADRAEILGSLIDRDRADTTREVAPLKVHPLAVTINTDEMTLDEVVGKALSLIDRKVVRV